MIENSSQPFDHETHEPTEPAHIRDSLAHLDDVLAASTGPKTEEQLREQDLHLEIAEAERTLGLIEERAQAGEEFEGDDRLRDEMTIQAVAAKKQLEELQNRLPEEE